LRSALLGWDIGPVPALEAGVGRDRSVVTHNSGRCTMLRSDQDTSGSNVRGFRQKGFNKCTGFSKKSLKSTGFHESHLCLDTSQR